MSSDNFTRYSFGGSLPTFYFNPGTSGVVTDLVIGTGPNLWKITVDTSDLNRLKFQSSSDAGATWVTRFAISPQP